MRSALRVLTSRSWVWRPEVRDAVAMLVERREVERRLRLCWRASYESRYGLCRCWKVFESDWLLSCHALKGSRPYRWCMTKS